MGRLFNMPTMIYEYEKLSEFAEEFKLTENDLVITNHFILDPLIAHYNFPCRLVFQEKYGLGEPSDLMVKSILEEVNKFAYDRIIGIGGGTVIDIAKMLSLSKFNELTDIYDEPEKHPRVKKLIIIPTTCGTGSEVTNVAVFELTALGTKKGMNNDWIYPDYAVLVHEMLMTLPFMIFLYSSADALIHAAESLVSTCANSITKIFSEKAIRIILGGYMKLVEYGPDYRNRLYKDFLFAGLFGGASFGNAGCGAVHALSYPIGGSFHVAHGESNYRLFTAVFQMYDKINPDGKVQEFKSIVADVMHLSEGADIFCALDELIGKLIPYKSLSEYGMTDEQVEVFSDKVIEGQQRLLAKAAEPLARDHIVEIYQSRFNSRDQKGMTEVTSQ